MIRKKKNPRVSFRVDKRWSKFLGLFIYIQLLRPTNMETGQLILISRQEASSVEFLECFFGSILRKNNAIHNYYVMVLNQDNKPVTVTKLLDEIENIYNMSYEVKRDIKKETTFTVLLSDEKYKTLSNLYTSIVYSSVLKIDSIPKICTEHVLKENIMKLELQTSIDINTKVPNKNYNLANSNCLFSSIPVVAVGGTFDHLHDGHKILLTISGFLAKDTLIIGVTGPELLKNKKYSDYMQSYEDRVLNVKNFLNTIKPSLKLDIYEINDVCGPTAQIQNIDALVVSLESSKGATYVNNVRTGLNWNALDVYTIGVLGSADSETFKNKLSSTDYRKIEYMKDHEE